jgi:hypothetical protein
LGLEDEIALTGVWVRHCRMDEHMMAQNDGNWAYKMGQNSLETLGLRRFVLMVAFMINLMMNLMNSAHSELSVFFALELSRNHKSQQHASFQ